MRSLTELIDTKEPAWTSFLQQWIKEAKNMVEVLPKDKNKADSTLYKVQVTTHSTHTSSAAYPRHWEASGFIKSN